MSINMDPWAVFLIAADVFARHPMPAGMWSAVAAYSNWSAGFVADPVVRGVVINGYRARLAEMVESSTNDGG